MTNSTNNTNRRQAITNFSEKPIVIIVGIIIALLGGVPGVLSIYNEVFSKPNLVYIEQTTFTADFTYPATQKQEGVIIPCFGLLNDGNKILYPVSFNLEVTHHGQRFTATNHLLKELFPNPYFKQYISLDTNMVDLAYVKKIEIGETIYGSLFFSFPLSGNDLRDTTNIYTIICKDAYNKSFNIKIPQHPDGPSKGLYFPKLNLSVK